MCSQKSNDCDSLLRKLAILIYQRLTTGHEYREPDPKQYEERVFKNTIIRLVRQTKELRVDLVSLESVA